MYKNKTNIIAKSISQFSIATI